MIKRFLKNLLGKGKGDTRFPDQKCRYCGTKLPVTWFELMGMRRKTKCPKCGVQYTPKKIYHDMGDGVIVEDDGPPK